jgi:hypothetical protein
VPIGDVGKPLKGIQPLAASIYTRATDAPFVFTKTLAVDPEILLPLGSIVTVLEPHVPA